MPLSVGPSIPTESNTAVPTGGFSTWFKNIGEWIKGMSPVGATQYDSGDIPLVATAGTIRYSAAYRRIGKTVYLSGAIGDTPVGLTQVAVLPAGFRPQRYQWFPSSINLNGNMAVSVDAVGNIQVWKGNGTDAATWVPLTGVVYNLP